MARWPQEILDRVNPFLARLGRVGMFPAKSSAGKEMSGSKEGLKWPNATVFDIPTHTPINRLGPARKGNMDVDLCMTQRR